MNRNVHVHIHTVGQVGGELMRVYNVATYPSEHTASNLVALIYCIAGIFRMVQIFAFFTCKPPYAKIRIFFCPLVVWGRDYLYTRSCVDEEVYIRMAIYRYFRPVDALPGPSGPLSASVSPAAVKDT